MIKSNNIAQKTLLYNLIVFDFILLTTSAKKISNFFVQSFKLNRLIKQLPLVELVYSFKRFIRMLRFMARARYNFSPIKFKYFYIWTNSEYNIELLKLLFSKFKLSCFMELDIFFPLFNPRLRLKGALILDQFLTKNNYCSFFFKKFYCLQAVDSFKSGINLKFNKIFADLNDFKKLIFIGLILVSIFKK